METRDAAWVEAGEVEGMRLFAPFADSWPRLREATFRPILVVDAANVMGARADGWWRDRVGAAARLRDQLIRLAARGMVGIRPYDLCYPEIVMVVEGAARNLPAASGRRLEDRESGRRPVPAEVRIVRAKGIGDDAIVDVVRTAEPGAAYVVVTADRELRARCKAAGATVMGPRSLLDQLDQL
jgi:hypothetical protein